MSRKRVTQALSRVRQAARHRKKEWFTALLHHLNVDTLRTAFLALKRKGIPTAILGRLRSTLYRAEIGRGGWKGGLPIQTDLGG